MGVASELSQGQVIETGSNMTIGTGAQNNNISDQGNRMKIHLDNKYAADDEDFLQEVFDILMEYIKKSNDRNNKILDFHQPEQILETMDFSLPDKPQNLDQILVDCKDALKYQVKTGHPRFLNQLSQGLDIISMAGEWLAATADTNMFTYEIAPVFLMMESEVLKKMRDIIGFDKGDSILAPGGSISNMYGLLCARHKFFPDYKTKGSHAINQEK